MPQFQPICTLCIHLRQVAGFTCDAFPDGIPDRIMHRDSLHLAPVDGDRGIQFTLDEDKREVAQAMVDAELLPASILTRSVREQDQA